MLFLRAHVGQEEKSRRYLTHSSDRYRRQVNLVVSRKRGAALRRDIEAGCLLSSFIVRETLRSPATHRQVTCCLGERREPGLSNLDRHRCNRSSLLRARIYFRRSVDLTWPKNGRSSSPGWPRTGILSEVPLRVYSRDIRAVPPRLLSRYSRFSVPRSTDSTHARHTPLTSRRDLIDPLCLSKP